MKSGTKAVAAVGIVAAVALIGYGVRTVKHWREDPLAAVRESQIAANVPAKSDFQDFLKRDITAYILENSAGAVLHDVTLLRDVPTQVGVGDPKYYVWVRASAADGSDVSGAARVAAIGREKFEVIQYFRCVDFAEDAQGSMSVFPEALHEAIGARVAAECPAKR